MRKEVEVEVESVDKAVEAVRAMYDVCEVVLGAEDFVGEASFRCAEVVWGFSAVCELLNIKFFLRFVTLDLAV